MSRSPRISPRDGSDVVSYDVGGGRLGARFDSVGRRRVGTTTKPVATKAAGAGTSPTVSNTGTDEHGTLTVVAGTSPATGALATLAFSKAYAATPAVVIVSPADAASAALQPYASATTSTLTIGVGVAPTNAATYKFNYVVVGG